jgi:uncharacterized protein (DUF1501 family)
MTGPALSRRAFAAGLSLPLLARVADAAVPANRKFVVIVCRGGMDGLSVAPPVGDPDYRQLRGALALNETALKLDTTFGLHPSLPTVHRLAQAGQARIAPAVATPDRARSHFEAQDLLETGAAGVYATSSGWLNRAVSAIGKVEAISVGPTAPLILRGPAAAGSWSPGRAVDAQSRLPTLLQRPRAACRPFCRTFTGTTRCLGRRSPAACRPRPWLATSAPAWPAAARVCAPRPWGARPPAAWATRSRAS